MNIGVVGHEFTSLTAKLWQFCEALSHPGVRHVEIEILHPETGVPTGAFIALSRPAEARRADALPRGLAETVFASYVANQADLRKPLRLDMCVIRTTGWREITRNGREWPFSVAHAREFYSQHASIVNQVAEFIAAMGYPYARRLSMVAMIVGGIVKREVQK